MYDWNPETAVFGIQLVFLGEICLMTNSTPISEQFYPFTFSLAQKLREANLSAAEWRFFCYLIELDFGCDCYNELDPLDIMRECRIGRSTYYRAKAKFQELGLYEIETSSVRRGRHLSSPSFATITEEEV